ncbi:winged helix-turn-helix transcriptional regulator [Paenibacillus shunpengii]|uniref:Winged helix-turn-helix transcriptional regulator n=1 Tax=Paenibacillus shunpengii TaxID=2054424 RepID=A0ABW5SN21_9BACL
MLWIHYAVRRYGELKRNISYITHKILSTQLKELEDDVTRHYLKSAYLSESIIFFTMLHATQWS